MNDSVRIDASDIAINPPDQRRSALRAMRRNVWGMIGCLVLSACAQPEKLPLAEGTYEAICDSQYGFGNCIREAENQCPDGYYTLDRISAYPNRRLLYRCGGT